MKNKEKYEEEIMEIAISGYSVGVINGKPARCGVANCELCIGNKPGYCNREKVREWAELEYKEPPVDWSKVPVDTKILVRDSPGENWRKYYFAGYENGKIYVFSGGATSWNTQSKIAWKYAKLAEE